MVIVFMQLTRDLFAIAKVFFISISCRISKWVLLRLSSERCKSCYVHHSHLSEDCTVHKENIYIYTTLMQTHLRILCNTFCNFPASDKKKSANDNRPTCTAPLYLRTLWRYTINALLLLLLLLLLLVLLLLYYNNPKQCNSSKLIQCLLFK